MEINDTLSINILLNLDDKKLEILQGLEYLRRYNYNLYQLLLLKNFVINKLNNNLIFDISEYNIYIYYNNYIDSLLLNYNILN